MLPIFTPNLVTTTSLLSTAYALPCIGTVLLIFCPKATWLGILQLVINSLLLLTIFGLIGGILHNGAAFYLNDIAYLDALSGWMLLLIGLIGFLASLFAKRYMLNDEEEKITNPWKLKIFYGLFNCFLLCLLAMVTLNSLGGYWIAIEASTIITAFLVGFYSKKEPVEAAWKYIILCTVGIAFALIGIVLTYYAVMQAHGSTTQGLNFSYLMTLGNTLDPNIIKAAFVFILIGLGTKAGLAPLHNWLPDAHSEAPTPVSALLSGVLIKCSFYGLIRYALFTNTVIDNHFTHQLFLFFGLLSLGLSVPFILLQKNVKRLLAYSSLEHVGIMAIGLGFGSPLALLGVLFHMLNHALGKSLLFFAVGNISFKFHSKHIPHITSAIHAMPITGSLMLLGALGLAGAPPFSVFISEFFIVWGGLQGHHWVASGLFVLFLTIAFAGFSYQFIQMAFGPKALPSEVTGTTTIQTGELNTSSIVAMLIPLLLLLLLTWWMPPPLATLLNQAVAIITPLNGGL
jgi:hydrogenase-4 component F